MSALPHFSRVDRRTDEIPSGTAGADAQLGEQGAPRTATAVRSGKQPTSVEARISSLKILAASLVREIQSLEEQGAAANPDTLDLQAEVHRFEAELIRSALVRTGGRQRRAARLLGMKVTTLNSKIRRYKIK